ncbi:ArsR/SmtB family transcription factor [Streptomyces halstedii]|uniref:ArsR/SmtB family transcription factor n=1 Tax=Streptomyces TaxID=1883 RepID=UPI00048FC68A|nr:MULTISPECIES: metalloregulator ArsR/SmtB family transcription factor [Streptomyces]MYR76214.1 metalloregulator ArsR/SmtB family transcription factor [Streptomyces sp. SID4925]MYY16763.1 metalloregulator ArsR/SmtB family transcription factor [Streptomyces sp. SID4912]SBU93384.1 transcriptional regulator, ArsR family [Streptomyces sp. OspMP-M45]SCE12919.1 transcriptional regulator, ArsR family [Streptomyces sp. DpondAA-D4]
MMTSVDADVVRVLGDPLRMRVVALLARETLCMSHLVEETGAKQTNLSNHMKVLREAGLVDTEPCGRFTYFKLRPEVLASVSARFAELAESARTAVGNKRACP